MRGRSLLPPAPHDAAALEVEHHLAEMADRLAQEGMSPQEARREAERRFGDLGRYRAALESDEKRRRRTMRRTEWWGVLSGGFGRAVRSLRRSPGFSAGVVLTLALGIGANAAMFGVLDRLLLQPPAHVVNPDAVRRVMAVGTDLGQPIREPIGTYPDYLDMKKLGAFEGVAAYSDIDPTTLGSGPDATQVQVGLATWDFFPLLGVHAERGRLFAASDDRRGATPTAVVSHEYWRAKMGSDPDVLGRTLELAGHAYTVVGVMPPGFTGVDLKPVDVWLPLVTAGVLDRGDGWLSNRGFYWLNAVARLAPSVDVRAAQEQATAALVNARRADIEKGNYIKDAHVALDPLVAARGPQASGESKVARWLGGVSLLVLLIACANVANLLLARGTRRRREVAVRLALGVGRARLVTTMVVESVLLALLGGGVALLLATWGGGIIRKTLLAGVFFPESAVSPRILVFVAIAAVVAGLLAGLGPALQGTRADLTGDLAMGAGSGAGGRSWTRAMLTVVQAALSVVLLVGAGLFVRSVSAVHHADLGLDVNRLVLASIEFETRAMHSPGADESSPDGGSDTQEQNQVYEEAMQRLAKVPGVAAVAGTEAPFQWGFASNLKVPGLDSIPQLPGGGPYYVDVTPGYFRTVGLKVTRGRAFRASDDAGAERVAMVSERMARTLWPHEDPLGKCLLVGNSKECTTVVGVVENANRYGIREAASMTYYMPLAQRKGRLIHGLYLRTSGDPARLAAEVAPVLRGLDPRIRYASVAPLQDKIDPEARSWTLGATLFTVFGLLALLVAAVGLYGVLAFDVAQRTRELGIRTALGAERARLLRSVVSHGLRMAVVGVVLGLGIALLAAPHVGDLLFKVSPRDPDVFIAVALALLLVALLASFVPGLRATRVDPMVALRTE
jgi:predicted permease